MLCALNVLVTGNVSVKGGLEFYRSIGISDIDAQTLYIELAHTRSGNSSLVDIACKTAQLSLSDSQVDTFPLNRTVVDEKW